VVTFVSSDERDSDTVCLVRLSSQLSRATRIREILSALRKVTGTRRLAGHSHPPTAAPWAIDDGPAD